MANASPDGAGAPSLGQRLSLEFANTSYAVRGNPREGIGSPEHLAAWLRGHAEWFATTLPADELREPDVAPFRALRDAIRALYASVVDGRPTPAPALDELNRAAAAAPHWPALTDRLVARQRTAAHPLPAARAELARDAIDLLAGPDRELLRRCPGPGCVLYFLKDHPRREWCSSRCGTRARVARHYQRHKTRPDDRGR
jgi:predicted RNA-binding Zn ribbon-like protein